MITKYHWATLLVLSSISFSLIAEAQEEAVPAETVDVPAAEATSTPPAETRLETIRENVAERRAALNERAQERFINLAANISNRFDAIIGRLTNISDRLDSRASKLAAEGFDVSVAQIEIARARGLLSAAASNMSTIDTAVQEAATANDARANWRQVRGTYEQVQADLIAARGHLLTALTALQNPNPQLLPEEAPPETL